MLKKIIAIATVLVILVSVTSTFVTAAELPAPVKGQMMIDVIVDGQKVKFPDTEPYIDVNNRTMVPVRFVSEKLGAVVTWDAANRIVGIKYGTKSIIMPLDSNVVKVDGADVTLDTTATLTEGRTMVPLRFVSEVLSSTVTWDAGANSVQVSDAAYLAKVADGSVKLDPWGRQISDKVSDRWNMLTDISAEAYALPIAADNPNMVILDKNYDPSVGTNKKSFSASYDKLGKVYYDKWADHIRKYYTAALNVDYRTIDADTFVKTLIDNMWFVNQDSSAADSVYRKYVEFVKSHHIITKGYADPEMYLARYDDGLPVIRTHFKFMVIQSDDNKQAMLDSYDVVMSDHFTFKFNDWYDGYADVLLYTNYGNNQDEHYAVKTEENMFRTKPFSNYVYHTQN